MTSHDRNARYKRLREDFCGADAKSSRYAVGAGSFGCVLVARDRVTGDVVALKRQRTDESARDELQHQIAMQMHPHRNVLHLRDFFFAPGPTVTDRERKTATGFLYTVHDLMAQSLRDMIKQRSAAFSRCEAVAVFSAICKGVAHLHAHCIVHGDLSTSNVLMNGWSRTNSWALNCDCRICDFGSSFAWPFAAAGAGESASRPCIPLGGRLITTAPWRAPEVVWELPEFDGAIDCWALGVHAVTLPTGTEEVFWSRRAVASGSDRAVLQRAMCTWLGYPPHSMRGGRGFTASSINAKPGGSIQAALTDPHFVMEPLGGHEDFATIGFIGDLLSWCPATRCAADVASTKQLFPGLVASKSGVSDDSASSSGELVAAGAAGGQPAVDGETTIGPAAKSAPPGSVASSAECAGLPAALDEPAGESAAAGEFAILPAGESAPPLIDVSDTPRCQCSANCGSRLCKRKRNRHRYSDAPGTKYCPLMPAGAGFSLCLHCKCLLSDCCRPRNRTTQPFCVQHGRIVKRVSANKYLNANGHFNIELDWSGPLKLTARWSMVFARIEPPDIVEVRRVVADCLLVVCGGVVLAVGLARTLLAHSIKWPPAVSHFAGIARGVVDAGGLVHAYSSAIRFASGQRWPTMFYRMDFGHLVHQTGLAFHAVNLDLLAPLAELARKTQPQTSDHVVLLGRNAAPFVMKDTQGAQHVVAECIRLAEAFGLTWPCGSDGLEEFGGKLESLIRSMRRVRCPTTAATFGCGESGSRHSYNIKSFVRVVMATVEAHMPEAMKTMPMTVVLEWCPDVGGHAKPLRAMRHERAMELFGGMSPLMIPYWACLAGALPHKTIKDALAVDPNLAWDVYDQHLAKLHCDEPDDGDPLYPPGPRIIAQLLAGDE